MTKVNLPEKQNNKTLKQMFDPPQSQFVWLVGRNFKVEVEPRFPTTTTSPAWNW
jgi:hypothetical protein